MIITSHLHCHATTTESFSLLLLNNRSMLIKAQALRLLVYTRKYDLILITETWLTDNTPDRDMAIIDYHDFSKGRIKSARDAVSYT